MTRTRHLQLSACVFMTQQLQRYCVKSMFSQTPGAPPAHSGQIKHRRNCLDLFRSYCTSDHFAELQQHVKIGELWKTMHPHPFTGGVWSSPPATRSQTHFVQTFLSYSIFTVIVSPHTCGNISRLVSCKTKGLISNSLNLCPVGAVYPC